MANDTVEIKITGDSSDLAAAMKDVADRLELLHQALAGTAGKFTEVGKDAKKAMGDVEKAAAGAADSAQKLEKEMGRLGKMTVWAGDTVQKLSKKVEDGPFGRGFAKFNGAVEKNRATFETAADSVGRMDSSLSAMSNVLQHVSPELAELSRMAADAAGASEQLILAFTQAPKAATVTAVALATLGVAYAIYVKDLQEIIDHHEKLGEANDKISKAFHKSEKAVEALVKELNILTGVETQHEQVMKQRLLTLESQEKFQIRLMKQRRRAQLQAAETAEEEANINEMYERGVRNVTNSMNVKRGYIQSLFDHADAADKAAKSEERRAKAISKASNEVGIQLNKLADYFTEGEDSFKMYALSMDEFQRAADGSAASMQKVEGMTKLASFSVAAISASFARSERAQGRFGTTNKSIVEGIEKLNESYKKRLGLEEDLFRQSRLGNRVFGAVNRSTGEAIGLNQILNMVMEENLRVARAKAEQDAQNAARVKAFVDERQRLIDSLEDENDAIEARLEGPAAELTNAYQKEIELLDETIEKYDKGSKTSETSARLIVLAEEQKILKTKEYEAALDEIIAKLTEQSEKQEEVSQDAAESLEKLVAVSEGAMGDEEQQHNRALSLLSERMEEQKQLVEDYYQEAIERGADSVESEKLRAEEMLQIEQEYQEKRDALDKEYTDAQRRRRVESIEMFGTASATLLQSTSDVLMAISQNADQLNEEQKKKMFYLSQAAAIGEVAISGIVAIANIWEEHAANPIFATALSAGMAGITAAQMSNLAAQKPSFDIGGVIRGGVMASSADQIGVNVLPGESVLNRSATERLGEQGVNNLNAGKGMGQEVIVVPSYRHFDRFIKDEYRKGGTLRRLFNDAREYPIGHRSY